MKDWEIDKTTQKCEEIDCPETREEKKELIIKRRAAKQIETLLQKYENLEWMAAMKGKENEKGEYEIEEIKLFEQEVTGVTVELTDKGNMRLAEEGNTIGWIHSHNTMGVFLSPTDIGTAGWNKISLVINNKLETCAKELIKLPCGRRTLRDLEVTRERDEMCEDTSKQADELIKEKKTCIYTREDNEIGTLKGEKGEYLCCLCGKEIKKRRHGIMSEEWGGYVHRKCFQEEYLQYTTQDYMRDTYGSFEKEEEDMWKFTEI